MDRDVFLGPIAKAQAALACLACLACVATWVTGCRDRPRAPPAPLATLASLDRVEVAGCAAVVSGPICEVPDDRVVRVALPESARDALFFTGTANARAVPIDGDAHVYRVELGAGASELRAEATDSGARRAWTLRLRPRTSPPDAVTEARALREQGKLAEAAALLEARARDAPNEADRSTFESALARVDIALGETSRAADRLARTMEAHAVAGRTSAGIDDLFARVFLLINERRFVEARTLIARGAERSTDFFDGRFMARFFEGVLARETGDARAALRKLEEAQAMAERLGELRFARMAAIDRALALNELARADDALTVFRALEGSSDLPPCQRSDIAANVGWILLGSAASQADGPPRGDPRAPLAAALALVAPTGACPDQRREGNVRTNLAWATLEHGDPKAARAELARARDVLPRPDAIVARFRIDLEGRIALAEGAPRDALAAYDRLAALARGASAVGDGWRAADGRAAALAAMGRARDAVDASAEAERLLDEESRGVPVGEGRAGFLGARERSARRRVELLLDAKSPAAALVAARASRARGLAVLERRDRIAALDDARRARLESALGAYRAARDAIAREAADDWSLPLKDLVRVVAARKSRERALQSMLEETMSALPTIAVASRALPLPNTGERLVAYFPLLRGWVAFVADGVTVTAARLGEIDRHASPDELGHALLDPLRERLAGATRIRLLVHGALADIDLHALPLDGAPLVARAPVEYALDFGALAAMPPNSGSLVVADPTSDLPAARREGRAVAASLVGARLLEGDSATRDAVATALGGTALFHYAGHGLFGGLEGWTSELPFADSSLGVADILAMPRPPRQVVLAACDSARTSRVGEASALGVAQAFLAAGSDVVIAATREVRDDVAAEIVLAFYDARAKDPKLDLASALRVAQTTVGMQKAPTAWSAFRALTR